MDFSPFNLSRKYGKPENSNSLAPCHLRNGPLNSSVTLTLPEVYQKLHFQGQQDRSFFNWIHYMQG